MGAAVAVCGLSIPKGFESYICGPSSTDDAMVLKVIKAPIEESLGALLSGFKEGDELVLDQLQAQHWLDPLGARFNDRVRAKFPQGSRFQATRRSWFTRVGQGEGWTRKETPCILQIAVSPDQRTEENMQLDLQDAKDVASYAHKFNLAQRQGFGQGEAAPVPVGEDVPGVRVAAPVGCEVVSSCYPAMIPVGSVCTLAAYPATEVRKFVFDGSEDFLEMPQSFFHHAAFSSNGKQFVYDLQGAEDEDGGLILVDPCVLRSALPGVADIVGAVAAPAGAGLPRADGPTGELFDVLHPKCSQLCKAFDPGRRSAKRAAGVCGVGGHCGLVTGR